MNMGFRKYISLCTAVVAPILFAITPALGISFFNGGTRALSMGNAYICICRGTDAIMWNPALVSPTDKLEISGNYAMLYSVGGLVNYSSAFAFNGGNIGGFGIAWNRLALKKIYSEDLISLSWGTEMFDKIRLGITAKSFIILAPGYEKYGDPAFEGDAIAFTGDIGLDWNALNNLYIGIVASNINSPEISLLSSTHNNDKLERNLSLGTSYTFSRYLVFSIDFHTHESDWGAIGINLGSEITFFDAIALRSGFSQGRLGIGIGLFTRHWETDFGFLSHKQLGNRYQLSLKLKY